MDESYKLTYPDGKCKKGSLIQIVILKGTIITCCNKKLLIQSVRKKFRLQRLKMSNKIISRIG